jgi:transposase-like protein
MTDEMMSLRGLLEKSADADLLREMIGFAVERLMELEVATLTGAGRGERNPDQRLVHRNGYRERDWEPRAGTGRWNCASRARARAAKSRASRRARWTIWSRPWA